MLQPWRIVLALCGPLALFAAAEEALAWGQGHRWIRRWAVAQQPAWVIEHFGAAHAASLWQRYTSLQDHYAGNHDPALARYCTPPERVSLHDVNGVAASLRVTRWYLQQIDEELRRGNFNDAMKFLGVLCHWHEDPGSLSAHSSRVSEDLLRELIPPRSDQLNKNYLYGLGWIGNEREIGLAAVQHQPQLLGTTIAEVAVQLTHRQELLRRHAAGLIVPAVIGHVEDDQDRVNAAIADALAYNARHIADLLYSVAWVTRDKQDRPVGNIRQTQRLTEWLSPTHPGRTAQPYAVRPFLIDQSLDAARRLHPLASFDADGRSQPAAFGIGMGTPFKLTCQLANAGVYDRLTMTVGLHPTAGPRGHVGFRVAVNGTDLWQHDGIGSGAAAEPVEIWLPETDVIDLTLETTAVADSESSHNLAVWIEPTLHRRPPDVQPAGQAADEPN